MKVFEVVANALHEEGVSHLFGLMGDGNLRLLHYWTRSMGGAYYGARHESVAVAMADGYARATGRLGVCTVTQGPGLTNSLTGLITARKAGSPVLLVCGDVASAQQGWPQDVDQDAVFAAAGVPLVHIRDASTPYRDVTAAIRLALRTGSPVGLNLPVDMQETEWVPWDDEPPERAIEPAQGAPATEAVEQAARILASARKPVIIAGRGAVVAGADQVLREIAERVGALLATTLRGKGLFSGHPYNLGIAGALGTNLAVRLIGEADTALVVGAGMNDFTTLRRTLLRPQVRLIRSDLLEKENVETTGERCHLTGDAAHTMPALLAELTRMGVSAAGYRTDAMTEELCGFEPASEIKIVSDGEFLDPRELTLHLDSLLPEDRVVVTDAGHFFGNPCTYMRVQDGRSFICGIDFGSIGLGLGHAIGAAAGHPGRPIVLFVGDGGLEMSLGDLETAVRYRIPLLVVVMNDAAYGSELQIMRMWGLEEELSVFPPADFAAVAAALGARTMTIRSLQQLSEIQPLDLSAGPLVLDCAINRDVRAAWLEEAFSR